ncbi:zinc transporter ZupT [Saprospira sp. CCB-QB6]|uniref:zinc transporter ZupT n=1 Tax=Saprospira sp. CCB-QB6 TaxID=3023936 RepID=UPI002349B747|nr:zinc transporter ZupT [Saprospira sp. CCB-QB6]WCL81564.1 zinc transporter ZupT [Saprospira sp. CCB-QB6]
MHEHFWAAFGLTVLAGLSTGIGSAIAFLVKGRNFNFLTVSMGFAAGVMLYVSFMEIFPHALTYLDKSHSRHWGVAAFFVGMLLVALIDKLIPHEENPHELMTEEELAEQEPGQLERQNAKNGKLMRVGLLTALALALHNFPEGMATFVAALEDPGLGLTIGFAIALHNIPEGIAVSMPVYYATGSKSKAFWYSFLSGVVEPIGAILIFALFGNSLDQTLMSILLAGVAGIMVFISLDQLLPSARDYGEHHLSIYGMLAGMAVMAISLLMLGHAH